MLELPHEYTEALEEVLNQGLSNDALESRQGKSFIQEIARGVAELSHGLTKDRQSFVASRYLNDAKLQRAYLTYYTTTNVLKIWPLLRELAASNFFENRERLNHLDIGTGTGAAIWGLATYTKHEQPHAALLDSFATDALSTNLTTTSKFGSRLSPKLAPTQIALRTAPWNISRDAAPREVKEQGPYDLITMMNVVNEVEEEIDPKLIAQLRGLLAPGGAILMIEPSTREQSRRALRFRDRLVEEGMFVYAPCTRRGGCPALIDPDNWCHTEVRWKRPGFIKAIDDLTGTLRLSLKYTYGVFLESDLNLSDRFQGKRDFYSAGRVVSERFDEKGRTRLFICNERGRLEYVMNKRDKTAENKAVQDAERYDLVQIESPEIREHDVKLTQFTTLHIHSSSDGCGNVDN